MSEAILRDAEIKDLSNMIELAGRLVEFEEGISGNKLLIEDKEERRKGIMEMLAESLVSPDYKIMVAEKSGRIMGLFISYINYMPKIFIKNKICNIWSAYSKKPVVPFNEVVDKFIEWAKERDCNGISAQVLEGNKKMQKYIEKKINADKIYISYEKEI